MLHDNALARSDDPSQACERRAFPRRIEPAEIVVRWHHEPGGPIRYELIDRSDGGVRIHSSLPMKTGMTAKLLRVLPEGRPLGRSAMVVWCRTAPEGEGYHLGMRFMEPA